MLVKTEGILDYTTAGEKRKSTSGNIYIHYLRACLIEHQQNFEFSMLRVLKSTLTYLPHNAKEKFIKQGCKIEN